MTIQHIFVAALAMYSLAPQSSHGQLFLKDDFDYPSGDSLRAHNWNLTGSTVNTIMVSSPGLSFAGYAGSDVGNAVTLVSTGQDLNRAFSSSDSVGSVYASFMVSVSAAQTGDYFFHLIQKPVAANVFAGKVFVRRTANGNLAFGISKRSNLAVYSDSSYSLNTTYLLVLKYTFNSGSSTDDQVSLHIYRNGMPLDSPPDVGPVTDGMADAASLDFAGLRQGAASSAPTLHIDGLRISAHWDVPTPIRLASFSAHKTTFNGIRLEWTTLSETNNYGFEAERACRELKNFVKISPLIPGYGTTLEPHHYSFTDPDPHDGTMCYRLKQIDLDNTCHYLGPVEVPMVTGVENANPQQPALDQNFPNPFNPVTEITFTPSAQGRTTLAVYDILGRNVATVFSGTVEAGRSYRATLNGRDLPSGTYLYRLDNGNRSTIRRMVRIK